MQALMKTNNKCLGILVLICKTMCKKNPKTENFYLISKYSYK